MEVRIVKRIHQNGKAEFVIQQKHWLFKWQWVDAWINSIDSANCRDNFDTLEEAKNNLYYFNGNKDKEEVVFLNDEVTADY